MRATHHIRAVALGLIAGGAVATGASAGDGEVQARLETLAEDYEADPSRIDATFGLEVDGTAWTVSSTKDGVSIAEGAPQVPALVYATDADTFRRILSGEMSALTALAQARASDPTPLQVTTVNGREFDPAALTELQSVLFHFFTTGQPEIVPLGVEHSRLVHGAQAAPIYYGDGLRTSWYGIAPGQHVNEDPADQVNPFASIFIFTEAGSARARIGGEAVELEDDQAIFVPAGMAHEFWNPGDETATFILIMFGENA